MMDAQNNWSDRTDLAMEQNDDDIPENIDQGAAITASLARRVFDEDFFAKNFSITRRAIQGRNAYAAWARKLGLTKKDDPEFLRINDELRKAGENLDKVLRGISPKDEKPTTQTPSQKPTNIHIAAASLSQDRPDSDPQGKKSAKRTRDSDGFISPPKHLTRKAPKADPIDVVQDVPTPDPDVDINILDPVVAASPPKTPKIFPFFVNPKGDLRTLITLAKLRPLPFSLSRPVDSSKSR
ncbi:hypothetical protein NPIL_51141 [Nephila pilipes]|uniref:Uncharacterized protein n=1 Tax=Nephila pilipes TaxID=299642 RepID=A0A8X6TXI3_NEPPI|nr:hypothetical protein NPIL_51141 [Nephila pilipes]